MQAEERVAQAGMSLSEILCVRHTITNRSMYAEQDEAEERSDCRGIGRAALYRPSTFCSAHAAKANASAGVRMFSA
jgi:hypothetical protein